MTYNNTVVKINPPKYKGLLPTYAKEIPVAQVAANPIAVEPRDRSKALLDAKPASSKKYVL